MAMPESWFWSKLFNLTQLYTLLFQVLKKRLTYLMSLIKKELSILKANEETNSNNKITVSVKKEVVSLKEELVVPEDNAVVQNHENVVVPVRALEIKEEPNEEANAPITYY